MTHQEQGAITLYIVTAMTILVLAYIISMTTGLLLYSTSKEIEPVNIDKIRVTSISEKSKVVSLEKDIIPQVPKKKHIIKKEKPLNEKEVLLLAKIINAEAGNQPYKGKLAVGNVVMNRVASPKFPDTIREVVYQKGQFSPVANGSINKKPNNDSIKAAKEILKGRRILHKDVLFFYNPDISTSRWIFTREVVLKIGEHSFAL